MLNNNWHDDLKDLVTKYKESCEYSVSVSIFQHDAHILHENDQVRIVYEDYGIDIIKVIDKIDENGTITFKEGISDES